MSRDQPYVYLIFLSLNTAKLQQCITMNVFGYYVSIVFRSLNLFLILFERKMCWFFFGRNLLNFILNFDHFLCFNERFSHFSRLEEYVFDSPTAHQFIHIWPWLAVLFCFCQSQANPMCVCVCARIRLYVTVCVHAFRIYSYIFFLLPSLQPFILFFFRSFLCVFDFVFVCLCVI